jgi:hypothetical protein
MCVLSVKCKGRAALVLKHLLTMAYRGVEVFICAFLISALDGGEWLGRFGSFTCRGSEPRIRWMGGRQSGPPESMCTIWKREEFLVPDGNRTVVKPVI